MIKLGQMVLKEVYWVQNDKIRSNGLEKSKFGTQHKNQLKWCLKESIWVQSDENHVIWS